MPLEKIVMSKLVLLRHGESEWNLKNLFTGWTDVDLTAQGVREAREAGRLLRQNGFVFDIAYTSVLKRAIRTLFLALDEMELLWIPVQKSWRLNERHYGALQGLNKAEVGRQYGEEQLNIWRRSYDVSPPAMTRDDERYAGRDPRYADLAEQDIPLTECLKDCKKRFLPFWTETIEPAIQQGRSVLIVAHGNSLRALVQHLDDLSNDEVLALNIPTGKPLVYTLDDIGRSLGRAYL